MSSRSPEAAAWPARFGWLAALTVATIVAVNAAGVWGIAVARRGAREEAERTSRLEMDAQARSIESALSRVRLDLAFLAASPAFRRFGPELASSDPREARWRRLSLEGALLLFLRGHPEVRSLAVRSASGTPLVAAGRRGGVPVLWMPHILDDPAGAGDPGHGTVVGSFDIDASPGVREGSLEARLDPAALLSPDLGGDPKTRPCSLCDAGGTPLAMDDGMTRCDAPAPSGNTAGAGGAGAGEALSLTVRTEGWSAPSPWALSCDPGLRPELAAIEPIARRYRMTILLDLVTMVLAVILGSFALQQARRRQVLEARAREETRVRALERQLFHAERLGTVGRLAAGIAHEINNPLEGMSNYLRLAREAVDAGDLPAARRRLESVREGLDRSAGVVRQVLQQADPSPPVRSPLDLNGVVSRTAGFVRSRREFAQVRFRLDLDPALPHVPGNEVMLGQVFLNIMLNACEIQKGEGEVHVRTYLSGGRVVVEISDAGPGVPEGERERVFEPFYTTKQASTGLGLFVCSSIVLRHGGEITLGGRPGGGARFRVCLPVAEEAAVPAGSKA